MRTHPCASQDRPPATAFWSVPDEASKQLLELVKSGYNPLDAYGIGALMPKVSAALSKLVLQCHNLYGYSRMSSLSTRCAAPCSCDPVALNLCCQRPHCRGALPHVQVNAGPCVT